MQAAFSNSRRPCLAVSCARFLTPARSTAADRREKGCGRSVTARAGQEDAGKDEAKYNTQFGYSRKDVLLIGAGVLALGYGLYYGLQAVGLDAFAAGNYAQLIIFVGLCVGWVGTYLFRVATKSMTYVTQLNEYEEAVMKKRLEEMTDDEMERLMKEVEDSKQK